MDMELPNLNYVKANKALYGTIGLAQRFPKEVVVHSHHTGRKVTFVQDGQVAEANDFWDGEMMEYFPLSDTPNVNKLVLWYGC